MAPEDKAVELLNKFKPYVHGYVGSSMLSNTEYPDVILARTKMVAIMVVDEIIWEINIGKHSDWIKLRPEHSDFIPYWVKVKKCITETV